MNYLGLLSQNLGKNIISNFSALSRISRLNIFTASISSILLSLTTWRSAYANTIPTVKNPSDIPEKILQDITEVWNKFSQTDQNGEKKMDYIGFLKAVALEEDFVQNATFEKQFKILFSLADKDHDSFLTFEEFMAFEILMISPEADYHIAFELFDSDKNGLITLKEFSDVLETTKYSRDFPFNVDCEWVQSFFGRSGANSITYNEFTQLLKGLEVEVLRQSFQANAKSVNNRLQISATDLQRILLSSFSNRIISEFPPEIRNNFYKIPINNAVTFPEFMAIYNVLMNLDRVREGIILASELKHHPQITKAEFLRVARRIRLFEFTPLETQMVFRIFDIDGDGLISLKDVDHLVPPTMHPTFVPTVSEKKSALEHFKESIVNFALGSVAGAIGAATVYPIDLVKTRMQNQRFTKTEERLYKNSWDCFMKVIKGEGFLGLYRGLPPQLVGVAPEKAIKLTVNDLLRSLFGKPGGDIFFPLEILAGGCAGASQVIFTNPIEIVKIRLQVQGESAKFGVAPKSTFTIIRELGLRGLYKGASACLLRDIPFSAIYFPAYAKFKVQFTNPQDNGQPGPSKLLIAGALAGVPAASLVTPADVIKTRLQVEARSGQQTYKNIPHCAATIFKTEGFRAFWKGTGMRVFRSSPQFGVTLLSYEQLRKFFNPNMSRPNPPTNAPVHQSDYEKLVRGGVGRSLRSTDERWGLFLGPSE